MILLECGVLECTPECTPICRSSTPKKLLECGVEWHSNFGAGVRSGVHSEFCRSSNALPFTLNNSDCVPLVHTKAFNGMMLVR